VAGLAFHLKHTSVLAAWVEDGVSGFQIKVGKPLGSAVSKAEQKQVLSDLNGRSDVLLSEVQLLDSDHFLFCLKNLHEANSTNCTD
jgi:hypothetical protein